MFKLKSNTKPNTHTKFNPAINLPVCQRRPPILLLASYIYAPWLNILYLILYVSSSCGYILHVVYVSTHLDNRKSKCRNYARMTHICETSWNRYCFVSFNLIFRITFACRSSKINQSTFLNQFPPGNQNYTDCTLFLAH